MAIFNSKLLVYRGSSRQGNVGTAAYLDVFGSIYAVMKELQNCQTAIYFPILW